MASDTHPPLPPVESTEAGAEAPAALKTPQKKAWSKPTIRISDGVLLYVEANPNKEFNEVGVYYPGS